MFPLKKNCNRYTVAHCYLVTMDDFLHSMGYLSTNAPGNQMISYALFPNPNGMVQSIESGTVWIQTAEQNQAPIEIAGTVTTSGLSFIPSPNIAITTANAGQWTFRFEVKFTTKDDKECAARVFTKYADIGI